LSYVRDADPDDTLVNRSLCPNLPDRFNFFGMKDEKVIHGVFLSTFMSLEDIDRDELFRNAKYATKRDCNKVYKPINERKENCFNKRKPL
jgi:hypothetical protein